MAESDYESTFEARRQTAESGYESTFEAPAVTGRKRKVSADRVGWDAASDRSVLASYKALGPCWKGIASRLRQDTGEARTGDSVRNRVLRLKKLGENADKNGDCWTEQEVQCISQGVLDGLRWHSIALQLPGRTASSCRNRWVRQKQKDLARIGVEARSAAEVDQACRRHGLLPTRNTHGGRTEPVPFSTKRSAFQTGPQPPPQLIPPKPPQLPMAMQPQQPHYVVPAEYHAMAAPVVTMTWQPRYLPICEAQFVAGPYPSHFQGMLPQAWQQAPHAMPPPPGWHFASAPAAPPAPASLAPSMAAPRPAAAAYVAAGVGAAAAREAAAAAAAQEDSNAREHDAEQRYYARLRSLVAQGRLPKGVADRIVFGGKSESSIAE